MIELANGTIFDFCVSSGALGFDGRGWPWERPLVWAGVIDPTQFVVVAKTVTMEARKGNLRWSHPWTCTRPLRGLGTVNAVGLTNPGLFEWVNRILPRSYGRGYRLAPSVRPETPKEAVQIAGALYGRNFPFTEVNLSCPNVGHVPDDLPKMLEILRVELRPLVLKLSYDQVVEDFVTAVDPYVDAYHAINTVPWGQIYHGEASPIAKYSHGLSGGVSGPVIKPYALDAVRRLRELSAKPVIGGGGIFSLDDVFDFEAAGASAFSIGTCFLHRPWRPNGIVDAYRALKGRAGEENQ